MCADLKLDNILIDFEQPSVISKYVEAQAASPMPRKLSDGRLIYLSQNDFGPLQSYDVTPKICDFGAAQRGDDPGPRILPIQPIYYRAPEAILGTGWIYSADIWNLGVLVS